MGRTIQGVAMYDPKTDTAMNWLRSAGNKNYGCMSMAKDTRGNLWFGTDKGLCFLDRSIKITPGFDLQKNLQCIGTDFLGESTVTSCVLYNSHTLAIGNAKGLHLLDLDAFYSDSSRIVIRSFNIKNGYQAGPVGQNAFFIDRDSCLWLTAANGALRYDPHALPPDTISPEVNVFAFIAGQDTIQNLADILELSSDQSYVQIFFSGSANPNLYDNVRFEYRFKGDTNWVKILPDAESVTFPSLKPGHYRFEIRAVKEGVFSKSKIIEFHISPLLWETPWFWLLILLLVMGIVTISWRREKKLSAKQLQLEKSNNEMSRMTKEKDKLQVQAIVNQLNPHFINNALQWLQVRVDEDEEAVRVVGKLSENISTVFKNSRMKKAFHSMREEMKLTENYLFIQKSRFGEKLSYEIPSDDVLASLGHINVPLMIIQIHAENAVEHGIRNSRTGVGKVSIRLLEEANYAVIMIEDDGVGREMAQKIGSRGTQNGTRMLQELQTIYNKQNKFPLEQYYEDRIFETDSGQRFGTRVIVRMPKHYNFEF